MAHTRLLAGSLALPGRTRLWTGMTVDMSKAVSIEHGGGARMPWLIEHQVGSGARQSAHSSFPPPRRATVTWNARLEVGWALTEELAYHVISASSGTIALRVSASALPRPVPRPCLAPASPLPRPCPDLCLALCLARASPLPRPCPALCLAPPISRRELLGGFTQTCPYVCHTCAILVPLCHTCAVPARQLGRRPRATA